MKANLIIGYGNETRRDDALGRRVAAEAALKHWEGVEVVTCRQLTPELAERVAAAERVVFVDAGRPEPLRRAPHRPRLARVQAAPRPTASVLDHAAGPRFLLELARTLFGRSPQAWTLTVPGQDFDFGEGLSDEGCRQVCFAVAALARWVGADSSADRLAGGRVSVCRGKLSCPI